MRENTPWWIALGVIVVPLWALIAWHELAVWVRP